MSDTLINLQYTTIKSPLPDFIHEGLSKYSSNANVYQPQPQVLVEKLVKKHGLPEDHIFLTAGIDEAIQLFAKTHGKNAFVFTPTYTVYADVEEFGGNLTRIPSITNNTYSIETKTIPGASLILLANPNNPSGFTEKETVIKLVKNNNQAFVCIDEAYGEFAPELSMIDQVKQFGNLAVFRSFSKDYAMAGNRIGYIVAQPKVIKTIIAKTQWCNVSYLSVGAATIALEHEDYFANIRKAIHEKRDTLVETLTKKGITPLPSKINAVLMQFPTSKKATHFVDYLTNHNIKVSPGNGNSNIGLDDTFVRIAIGTDEQMEVLEKVIHQYDK